VSKKQDHAEYKTQGFDRDKQSGDMEKNKIATVRDSFRVYLSETSYFVLPFVAMSLKERRVTSQKERSHKKRVGYYNSA
jgi:hypothetical protein